MPWIKQFAKSAVNLYKGQVLEGFKPIDFYHFFPLWYDLWIARVAMVIKKLEAERKSYRQIKDLLPLPSNWRAVLAKMIPSYYAQRPKNRHDYKTVANFLAKMLKQASPTDPFARRTNLIHSPKEINDLVEKIRWQKADLEKARQVGKLITAAGSLVHGLYNDVVTDMAWDAYGPYAIKRQSLLIRHFPNLQPIELWPKSLLPRIKKLLIYAIYEGVEWEISFVGCHTLSRGVSPVLGMKKFAVYADDRLLKPAEIQKLIEQLSGLATAIYKKINCLSFEQLKLLVARQVCYQFKLLFDEAKVDWQPTPAIKARFKNKSILKGVFPHGKFINSVKEYERIFGLNTFAKEILNE